MNISKSFTTISEGIALQLANDASIGIAFDPNSQKKLPVLHKFKAIWDTGATGSVITEKVVKEVELQQVGLVNVQTPNGVCQQGTYYVSLWLPGKVAFSELKVTCGDLGDGVDILIGMDVMNKGDFSVSNFNGITTFSFRVPSKELIDFTGKLKPDSKCICGSGKLFKDCHGKINRKTK